MNRSILSVIWSRVQCSPAESLTLQVITNAGNVFGQNARLSYDILADRTGFSVRWCMELVRRLEAKRLLRVLRQRLGYAHYAVNVYSVVRPWVRELDYREALRQQKESAHLRTPERGVQVPKNTQRENRVLSAALVEEDLRRLGIEPGSFLHKMTMEGVTKPEHEGVS